MSSTTSTGSLFAKVALPCFVTRTACPLPVIPGLSAGTRGVSASAAVAPPPRVSTADHDRAADLVRKGNRKHVPWFYYQARSRISRTCLSHVNLTSPRRHNLGTGLKPESRAGPGGPHCLQPGAPAHEGCAPRRRARRLRRRVHLAPAPDRAARPCQQWRGGGGAGGGGGGGWCGGGGGRRGSGSPGPLLNKENSETWA